MLTLFIFLSDVGIEPLKKKNMLNFDNFRLLYRSCCQNGISIIADENQIENDLVCFRDVLYYEYIGFGIQNLRDYASRSHQLVYKILNIWLGYCQYKNDTIVSYVQDELTKQNKQDLFDEIKKYAPYDIFSIISYVKEEKEKISIFKLAFMFDCYLLFRSQAYCSSCCKEEIPILIKEVDKVSDVLWRTLMKYMNEDKKMREHLPSEYKEIVSPLLFMEQPKIKVDTLDNDELDCGEDVGVEDLLWIFVNKPSRKIAERIFLYKTIRRLFISFVCCTDQTIQRYIYNFFCKKYGKKIVLEEWERTIREFGPICVESDIKNAISIAIQQSVPPLYVLLRLFFTYESNKLREQFILNEIFTIIRTSYKVKNIADKILLVCANYVIFLYLYKNSCNEIGLNKKIGILQKVEFKLDWHNVEFKNDSIVINPPADKTIKFLPKEIRLIGSKASFNYLRDYFDVKMPDIDCVAYKMQVEVESAIELERAILYISGQYKNYIVKKGKTLKSMLTNKKEKMNFEKSYNAGLKIDYNYLKKYNSVYINRLIELQSNKYRVIPLSEQFVYSNGNAFTEEAFMFTREMRYSPNHLMVIIENVNPDRATLIFTVNKKNYRETINMIYDYMAGGDYNKRSSLRNFEKLKNYKDIIDFKASNHDNTYSWKGRLGYYV